MQMTFVFHFGERLKQQKFINFDRIYPIVTRTGNKLAHIYNRRLRVCFIAYKANISIHPSAFRELKHINTVTLQLPSTIYNSFTIFIVKTTEKTCRISQNKNMM